MTVLSIIGAYLTARYFYLKEKADSETDKRAIEKAEIDLFDNNISDLKYYLNQQIKAIDEYVEKKDFSLSFSTNINVEFLKYIDVKTLYKIKNIEGQTDLKIINDLLAKLFFLKDFQSLLRNEVQIYIKRYNEIESEFNKYKKLLYTDYFLLVNKRSQDIQANEGKRIIQFHPDDNFIKEYLTLRDSIFLDEEVIKENSLQSKKLLHERFVLVLTHICENYIPQDSDAIQISAICNDVNSAHNNFEEITKKHFIVVDSYRELLKSIIEKVQDYSN